jgi:hypothetical protein
LLLVCLFVWLFSELEVIVNPLLQQRLERIVAGTRNTSQRGGIFGHLLFFGQPGTGTLLFPSFPFLFIDENG